MTHYNFSFHFKLDVMTSNCQGKGPKGAKLVTVATKLTKNIKKCYI